MLLSTNVTNATGRDLSHIEGILVKTLGNEQKCMGEEQFSLFNIN